MQIHLNISEEKEIESGERGQGDQFELMSIIEAQSIIMCDKETNEIVMAVPKGTLRFQFRDDDLVQWFLLLE